jgi:hypothetical protein
MHPFKPQELPQFLSKFYHLIGLENWEVSISGMINKEWVEQLWHYMQHNKFNMVQFIDWSLLTTDKKLIIICCMVTHPSSSCHWIFQNFRHQRIGFQFFLLHYQFLRSTLEFRWVCSTQFSFGLCSGDIFLSGKWGENFCTFRAIFHWSMVKIAPVCVQFTASQQTHSTTTGGPVQVSYYWSLWSHSRQLFHLSLHWSTSPSIPHQPHPPQC